VKIKVAQICSMGDEAPLFLDDKGRVWYDGEHMETYHEKSEYAHPDNKKTRWITEWKQLELPDEPEQPHAN